MENGWLRKSAQWIISCARQAYRPLQGFFHWKFSGTLIPLFWGTVVAMVGIATAYSNAEFFFNWAYVFAALFLIWSLGYWLTSGTLEKKENND